MQRWEWRNQAKGILLSYSVVISNYALFRLPVTSVLNSSQHYDGLVKSVEFLECLKSGIK